MNTLLAPGLSVMLVTPNNYQTIRKTIRHLGAQTARDRMEVVIVAPSRANLGLVESELAGFQNVVIVEVGEIKRASLVKMAGVRAASAAVVAFAEDHCYPEPEWAARLIAAHDGNWAAVGPLMLNANPRTMLSWAGLVLHFGCCIEETPSHRSEHLPWHNIAYKRDLLLGYGERLPGLIAFEGFLLADLKARGHEFYFDAAAKTAHVNVSRWRSWIPHSYWGGRMYGGLRVRNNQWPLSRRLLYTGGAPLIPFIRFYRTCMRIHELGLKRKLLPWVFPAMVSGLIAHTLGEMSAYAFGMGNAEEQYMRFELSRFKHIAAGDRHIMID